MSKLDFVLKPSTHSGTYGIGVGISEGSQGEKSKVDQDDTSKPGPAKHQGAGGVLRGEKTSPTGSVNETLTTTVG